MSSRNFLILLMGFFSPFASSVFAADGFGITAGLNLANASFTPKIATSSKAGFEMAGHYLYSFHPSFAIEPGLSFVQRGYTQALTSSSDLGVAINYLEIPVLLKGLLPLGDATAFLGVGPNIGFKISASCSVTSGNCNVLSDDYKSTEFGAEIALGAALPMGGGELTFQARTHLGLSNINNIAGSVTTIKNSGLAFLVGWNFL